MIERTRCKFYVASVTRHGFMNGEGKPVTNSIEVRLCAVYAPKDDQSENHKFWSASPSGELKLSVNNPACFDFFKEGHEMYLDLTPAPVKS